MDVEWMMRECVIYFLLQVERESPGRHSVGQGRMIAVGMAREGKSKKQVMGPRAHRMP